ncbi:MAG: hypothetical protein M0Z75_12255 [Nitrospiraceae bacterium]|nr:hypothetical protein [Nitrospiraceae bacterium]
MILPDKKILIFDEARFSRICQAILATEGYDAVAEADPARFPPFLARRQPGLIITSYPFGDPILEQIKWLEVPVIILSDHIDAELLKTLEGLKNSCCLLKPLDYRKFKDLVRHFFLRPLPEGEGYRII